MTEPLSKIGPRHLLSRPTEERDYCGGGVRSRTLGNKKKQDLPVAILSETGKPWWW